jgi:hypothetical protein
MRLLREVDNLVNSDGDFDTQEGSDESSTRFPGQRHGDPAVSDHAHERIEAFARRLESLTADFEDLRREVGAAEAWEVANIIAHEQAVEVPAWLRPLDDLFRSGAHNEALRMAEWNLAQRFDSYSAEQLEELRAYLQRIDTPERGRRDDLISLIGRGISSRREPTPAAAPREPFSPPSAKPASVESPVQPPATPREPREPLQLDLLGPRALAIAGGIVTLLGIIFFFVLAVNRGWIGPHGRVALGGIAAAIVFGAGIELKRRYGTTYSALAAVGAGIAGGYATLLSAASLYHMLSPWGAMLVAGAIAAAGLATSLAWRSQIVAGIGLLGAMLVPVFVAAQGGVSVLAVAFVAVVFAVLAAVSIRLDWHSLLVAGGLASAPQLLALAFAPKYEHQSPAGVLALVSVFFLLYAATGVVRHLRSDTTLLDPIVTAFVLGAGVIAAASFARLFATGEQRGVALLVLAAAYAAPGAFFFTRERTRDLSALLTFATFTLTAIGFALLLHGDALAYAWAAEAAGLAWLSWTVGEIRFQLWSGVYLVLALIHSLIDAPPRHLTELTAHPAAGVGTIVAVAAAAAVFSFYARPWREDDLPTGERRLAGVYEGFAAAHRVLGVGSAWLSLALSTYAVSLGVLALFSSFAWATVTNAAIWMAVGLAMLALGFRSAIEHVRLGALVWLGMTGLLAVEFASRFLVGNPRAIAIAVVGVAALAASLAYGLIRHEGTDATDAVPIATVVISLALFAYPTEYRLEGHQEGAAALGLAALYALLSIVLARRPARDPSTAYWAIAIAVAAFADVRLLHGTYAVLGWAAAGVAIAWLAGRVREPRLYLGATVLVTLAVVRAFAIQAPPTHLFTTRLHPAYGTASIFIAALAIAGLAYFARSELGRLGVLRTAPWWLAGVLTVYGLSLLIVELVERISSAPSLHTEFQRGQTAVSAFWGLLGLTLLYVGLKRNIRPLRIAGLACFPIILAKIFIYDLPQLSPVTRALSFLAVGAVLLLGGFFYQRLMSDRDEPRQPSAGNVG